MSGSILQRADIDESSAGRASRFAGASVDILTPVNANRSLWPYRHTRKSAFSIFPLQFAFPNGSTEWRSSQSGGISMGHA